MQSAITNLFGQLANVLAPLSPFTKAIVPAALSLATAAVKCGFDGKLDATSLTIAGCGLVLALVVYFVPNKPKATPAVK